MSTTVRVWDLAVRLFHWLFALAVAMAVTTGKLGGSWIDWHGRVGVFIVGLLCFRIIWGFLGSTHARFASFFPTPRRLTAYLRGQWRGLGHNPLGALSVFALLGVSGALASTGLFANDDLGFQGPLATLVSKDSSDRLGAWHSRLFPALAALVCLHLAAMAFYALVKGNNLIVPMLTGRTHAPEGQPEIVAPAGRARLLVALAIAGAVAWAASGDVLPRRLNPPSATSTAASPDW